MKNRRSERSLRGSSKSIKKASLKSSSSSTSRSSTKDKAIQEKVKVPEFMTEASFITKKRDAEYQVQRLTVVKDLGKS